VFYIPRLQLDNSHSYITLFRMYTLAVIFIVLFAVVNVATLAFLVFQSAIQEWGNRCFQDTEYIRPVLKKHFRKTKANDLHIVSRSFQKMLQIELYREIQKILDGKKIVHVAAIETYNTTRLSDWISTPYDREFTPLKYIEVDIGEEKHIRCLNNVFYLWHEGSVPMALLLIQEGTPQMLHVDIAVPKKYQECSEIEQIMKRLEEACKDCESYKPKLFRLKPRNKMFAHLKQRLKFTIYRKFHVNN